MQTPVGFLLKIFNFLARVKKNYYLCTLIFFCKMNERYICYAVLAYWLLINVVAWLAYCIDKHKAKKGAWRIPEARLLWYAALGGSLGALIGMKQFRHKTQHWKFRILVPLFFLLQLAALVAFYTFRLGWWNWPL